jgi:hypothetical protein
MVRLFKRINQSFGLIPCFVIVALLCQGLALADETTPLTLNAGVATVYVLPQGMLGLWSVQATLRESPHAELFPTVINDIWQFSQTKDAVTLSNPNTGGSATVQVEAVQDNQARFYHVVTSGRQTFIERPDVEVQGNTLRGTTTIERLVSQPRNGGGSQRFWAKYTLTAQRLNPNQAPVIRTTGRSQVPVPSFEIAPLQPKGTPLPW